MRTVNTVCISKEKKGIARSSTPEVFLRKRALKTYSRVTGEWPCRLVISIKLLFNFIEITLRDGYSPVNLQQIFRAPFYKNTSGGLLLYYISKLISLLKRFRKKS